MSKQAWLLFIDGRIAQEQGDIDLALLKIKQALDITPSNPSFLRAYASALLQKASSSSATGSDIENRYQQLAAELAFASESDTPNNWIPALEELKQSLESAPLPAPGAAALVSAVAW